MTITVYSKPACVQCTATKRWLDQRSIEYTTHDVSTDENALAEVVALGYQQAPVVVVSFDDESREDEHWSGFRPDLLLEVKRAA